jgi:hypothetical protein
MKYCGALHLSSQQQTFFYKYYGALHPTKNLLKSSSAAEYL